MQAYTRHSFLLICKAYPPQNKMVSSRTMCGLPILHTDELCAVSAMLRNELRNIRAPASSPDDCRNAVVFFLFVVQLRCFAKENIRDCMQASIRYFLYRDMHSISTTNKKNVQLAEALLWGYLGRVFPHRASATFGTPSVTAKAVRAPRRWCNCVV